MKYGQKLPKKVEQKLDDYIERIKAIKWFKPAKDIKREDIDNQVNIVLKSFGVEASIEYRSIKREEDWEAAREAAREAAWSASWSAAWDAAREASWDAARGACDVLVSDIPSYQKKYNNGSFRNLIPLWEAGLYPCGVINGKFIVYVPEEEYAIPQLTGSISDNYAVVNGIKYKLILE